MSVIRDCIHISFLVNNPTNLYIIYTSNSIYTHTQVLDDGCGIRFHGSGSIWLCNAVNGLLLINLLQPPCVDAARMSKVGVLHTYWYIWSDGSVNERVEDNRDGVPALPHRRMTLGICLHMEDYRRGSITPYHHQRHFWFPECMAYLVKLDDICQAQHCIIQSATREAPPTASHDMYCILFPRVSLVISFPVEGCQGRFKIHTNLCIHFMHLHVWDMVEILDKVNCPQPWCAHRDIFIPWNALNSSHPST